MTIDQCHRNIEMMATLNDGWDSYKAPAINSVARANATAFCNVAASVPLLPNRVTPAVVGAVAVIFCWKDKTGFVEFYNGGTAAVILYRQGRPPATFKLSIQKDEFRIAIDRIINHLEGVVHSEAGGGDGERHRL